VRDLRASLLLKEELRMEELVLEEPGKEVQRE
jgi:hypothetical protein